MPRSKARSQAIRAAAAERREAARVDDGEIRKYSWKEILYKLRSAEQALAKVHRDLENEEHLTPDEIFNFTQQQSRAKLNIDLLKAEQDRRHQEKSVQSKARHQAKLAAETVAKIEVVVQEEKQEEEPEYLKPEREAPFDGNRVALFPVTGELPDGVTVMEGKPNAEVLAAGPTVWRSKKGKYYLPLLIKDGDNYIPFSWESLELLELYAKRKPDVEFLNSIRVAEQEARKVEDEKDDVVVDVDPMADPASSVDEEKEEEDAEQKTPVVTDNSAVADQASTSSENRTVSWYDLQPAEHTRLMTVYVDSVPINVPWSQISRSEKRRLRQRWRREKWKVQKK